MKLFIFSDLNISSIQSILKSYFSSFEKIIFNQIKGLGWEESIQNIKTENVCQSDFVLFVNLSNSISSKSAILRKVTSEIFRKISKESFEDRSTKSEL